MFLQQFWEGYGGSGEGLCPVEAVPQNAFDLSTTHPSARMLKPFLKVKQEDLGIQALSSTCMCVTCLPQPRIRPLAIPWCLSPAWGPQEDFLKEAVAVDLEAGA
jgi:hypothetical protein